MLRKHLLWAILPLCLVACNTSSSTEAKADSTAVDYLTTNKSIASDTVSINERKRIRTADIKCRVSNVFETTIQLERLATRLDGAITESHIENEPFETKELAFDNDSLKKIQLYIPTAHLTLRVPEKFLDSVVYGLSQSAKFINYRTLRQTDVTLQYLSNTLKNEAEKGSQIPISNNEKNKLDLLQYKDDRQQKVINRKIENLQLTEDVRYATLTILLFQPPMADISIQLNPDAIIRTGFAEQMRSSLNGGVEILRALTLFILGIWPLFLLTPVAWAIYKRYGKSIVR